MRSSLSFVVVSATVALLLATAGAGASPPSTPGEESGYSHYTQADEVATFLSRLDTASAQLVVRPIGRAPGTATVEAEDLLLAVLSAEGAATPAELDRRRPTVFLFASQHGDEQSAKEAALALVRDLAVGELRPLLERINVLVLPQANPYGNRVDQRLNEQQLDLNRDHSKLEAPATEAIHSVFLDWLPEVTVDAHEKGDDYYRASYGCVSNPNIHGWLQQFCRGTLLAEVGASLEELGVPFHEYLVSQPLGIESASGAALPADVEDGRPTMLRYSTTDVNDGRNSLGIFETLSMIFEGASRGDLATLGSRTGWQLAALKSLLASVASHGEEIVSTVTRLRRELVERAGSPSADDLVHLRLEYLRSASQPTLPLRRYVASAQPALGILQRAKAAGDPVYWDDLESSPHPPGTAVEDVEVELWFPDVGPTLSVPRPRGYVVPREHRSTVEILVRLGVEVHLIAAETRVPLEHCRVRRIVPAELDYLAPQELDCHFVREETTVPGGSFFVPSAQLATNLVTVLLEPQSTYGLLRYRKLGLVPDPGSRFAVARWLGEGELTLVPYKGWARPR